MLLTDKISTPRLVSCMGTYCLDILAILFGLQRPQQEQFVCEGPVDFIDLKIHLLWWSSIFSSWVCIYSVCIGFISLDTNTECFLHHLDIFWFYCHCAFTESSFLSQSYILICFVLLVYLCITKSLHYHNWHTGKAFLL